MAEPAAECSGGDPKEAQSIAAKALTDNDTALLATVLPQLPAEMKHRLLTVSLMTSRTVACIHTLLAHGAPLIVPGSPTIPLHTALRADNIPAAALLCDACSVTQLNEVDGKGDTAVLVAVRRCSAPEQDVLPVLSSMLARNALPSQQDKHGRTALHYAIWAGKWQLVKALLHANANLDVTDNSGFSCRALLQATTKWTDGVTARVCLLPATSCSLSCPFLMLLDRALSTGTIRHLRNGYPLGSATKPAAGASSSRAGLVSAAATPRLAPRRRSRVFFRLTPSQACYAVVAVARSLFFQQMQ